MQYTAIMLEVRDNVAHITLNRPDATNSMNLEMARELMDATIELSQSPKVRAVLVSGAGRIFCSGGDIKEFGSKGKELPRHVQELTTYLHAAVSRLVHLKAPVIAAVHGSAAGAGLPFACSADIVLAAESARFTLAYTRIGLAPDGGSTFFLPRLVGLKRSLELALLNRVLSAQEAMDWGMVTRIIPDTDLFNEAQKLASELAAGPTGAFAAAKRLMYAGWTATLETQMERESQGITSMAATADAAEGISAFLAKRPAVFEGQ